MRPLALYTSCVVLRGLQLTFFSVFLRDDDPCNDTYIDVLNGGLASAPSIVRLCALTRRTIQSQSNRLRIVYHTVAAEARTNRFRIMYRRQTRGMDCSVD